VKEKLSSARLALISRDYKAVRTDGNCLAVVFVSPTSVIPDHIQHSKQ